MCNQCHSALSDADVEKSMDINNPQFEVWNSTSLNHLRLAAMGVNGPVVQEKAERLFIEYMKYYKNLPEDQFVPAVYQSLEDTLEEIQKFRIKCQENKFSQTAIKDIVFHNYEESFMDLIPSFFGIGLTCLIIYYGIKFFL